MSVRSVHELAAQKNVRLLAKLDDRAAVGTEWMPSVLYYLCVQLLEAALADFGEHPKKTIDRKSQIAARWPSALIPWESLRQLSERWRYDGREADQRERQRAHRWAAAFATAIGEAWPT